MSSCSAIGMLLSRKVWTPCSDLGDVNVPVYQLSLAGVFVGNLKNKVLDQGLALKVVRVGNQLDILVRNKLHKFIGAGTHRVLEQLGGIAPLSHRGAFPVQACQ